MTPLLPRLNHRLPEFGARWHRLGGLILSVLCLATVTGCPGGNQVMAIKSQATSWEEAKSLAPTPVPSQEASPAGEPDVEAPETAQPEPAKVVPNLPVFLAQGAPAGSAKEEEEGTGEDGKPKQAAKSFAEFLKEAAERSREQRERAKQGGEAPPPANPLPFLPQAQPQPQSPEVLSGATVPPVVPAISAQPAATAPPAQPTAPAAKPTTPPVEDTGEGVFFDEEGASKPAAKTAPKAAEGECSTDVSPTGIAFHGCPLDEVIREFNSLTGENFVLGVAEDALDPATQINYEFKMYRPLEKEDYKDIFEDFLKRPTKDDAFKLAVTRKNGKKVIRLAYEINTDKLSLPEIIDQLCKYLEINYILSPQAAVGKNVTIVTHKNVFLTRDQIHDVLYTILAVNGLGILEKGDYYKIYPLTEAKEMPLDIQIPEGYAEEAKLGEKFSELNRISENDHSVMQIIPLKYVAPDTMANLIRPFMTKTATVTPHKESGILIVTEVASNLKKTLKLIEMLDVDDSSGMFEVLQVIYADATEVSGVLKSIISSKAVSSYVSAMPTTGGRRSPRATATAAGGGGSNVFIEADKRSNSILIFGTKRDIDFAKEILTVLDKDIYESTKTFIYYCENAKAEDLANLLNSVYGKGGSSSSGSPGAQKNTQTSSIFDQWRQANQQTARTTQKAGTTGAKAISGGDSGALVGDLTIVPDERTNSLIIVTSDPNYQKILRLLKDIDAEPKQVLIEILYAEVTLDEANSFGVDWSSLGQGKLAIGGKTYGFDTTTAQSFGTTAGNGLNLNIFEATRFNAFLKALSTDDLLKVLSNPHLLASNNLEASIQIGDTIPVVTERTSNLGNVDPAQFNQNNYLANQSIQYRDTGILLTITPHINENRFVTLEIQQEISEVKGAADTASLTPSVQKRSLTTTAMVRDGMSLALGGLIKTVTRESRSMIPWLGKIPFLGNIFSNKANNEQNIELLMIITPHVVANLQEATQMTDILWERNKNVKKYYEANKERFY